MIAVGRQLGNFRIEAPIGAGGMAEVYRARDQSLDREVALKVLASGYRPEALERFRREAKTLAALDHPNICTIHTVGKARDSPYIVMELVDGQPLSMRLRDGFLPVAEALGVVLQLTSALEAAHERGVVHRDLKPSNLMLGPKGHVTVLDFGLAKPPPLECPADPSEASTAGVDWAVETVGTWPYMSPEQIRADPTLDRRTDIWAFGCILFELLAGEPAFQRETAAETLAAILDAEPDYSLLPSLTPPEIVRVLQHCLRKDVDERLHDIADARLEIEDALNGGPGTGAASRTPRPGWFRPWRPAFVLAGAALLLVAATLWVQHRITAGGAAPSAATMPRYTPLLTSAASEKDPAWSLQGNFIAYASDAGGNWDVWVCDASGADRLNLTEDHPGVDDSPVWSPDGTRLAFYSDRDGPGIYTMSAFGGQVRKLTPVSLSAHYMLSLRAGAHGDLVFTDREPGGTLEVKHMGWDGAPPRCLTCGLDLGSLAGGDVRRPGDLLVFSGSDFRNLFVADLSSTSVKRVFHGQVSRPTWTPDGRAIWFLSSRDHNWDLWEQPYGDSGEASGPPIRRTVGLELKDFAIDPTGTRLLAERDESTRSFWALPTTLPSIATLDEARQLFGGEHLNYSPRWLNDGSAISFLSDRRGSSDVWTLDLADVEPTRVTTDAEFKMRARPSPQGDWIAYEHASEGDPDVLLIRPDGSGLHRLFSEEMRSRFVWLCCIDWRPDGGMLALSGRSLPGDDGIALVSLDTASGLATDVEFLYMPGALEEFPRWSPNGRFLAFESVTDDSWDLWLANADGGQPRRLTRDPGSERAATWAADGRTIFYVNGAGEIWRLPVDENGSPTGAATAWFVPPPRTRVERSLDVAGSTLLALLVHELSDIWLVEFGEPLSDS